VQSTDEAAVIQEKDSVYHRELQHTASKIQPS